MNLLSGSLKSIFAATLSTNPMLMLGQHYCRQFVPIFMLHRFSCPQIGVRGHDVEFLRRAFELLRKKNFNFISIEDLLLAILHDKPLPKRSIAFSIDDGYWDHVEVPARIFSLYDCPVTYFVVSSFIDQKIWMWDSKVEYIIDRSSMEGIGRLHELVPAVYLGKERHEISSYLVFELTKFDVATRDLKIEKLSSLLNVNIPAEIPEKYAATTWSRLRDIERMGMKIAPHTHTHPILSNESNMVVTDEIVRSWNELCMQIKYPSKVFCYPVGREQDFGAKELEIVKEKGFLGAVSAIPGPVNIKDRSQIYRLPRYGFPDNQTDLIQYSSWIESFKSLVRG